jgi:hypothetical protein
VDERVQNLIAKPELLFDGQRPVPEDSLMQFAGSASSEAAVGEREVVEYEQLAGV